MAIRIVGDPQFNFFDWKTTGGTAPITQYVRVSNLKSLTFGGHSRSVIDVTSWDEADDVMKSAVGQIDPGDLTVELFYDPSDQSANPTELLFNEFQVAAGGAVGAETPLIKGLYRLFKEGNVQTFRHRMEVSRAAGTSPLTQDNITFRDAEFAALITGVDGPDVQQGDAISASLSLRLNSLITFSDNTVDDQTKRGYTT